MQAILRRTARAQTRAVRKNAKKRRLVVKETRNQDKRNRAAYWATIKRIQDEAQRAARLDWKLGPLAPKRQVDPEYGTVTSDLLKPPRPADPNVGTPIPPDTPKLIHRYFSGDRVVIIRGTNAGKIGVIDSVDEKTGSVLLKESNLAYVEHPQLTKAFVRDSAEVFPEGGRLEAVPVPMWAIRLVHHMRGRDVVVDKMLVTFNTKDQKKPKGLLRQIPGTLENLDTPRNKVRERNKLVKMKDRINHPKTEATPKYQVSDTYRIETDKQSWIPTLEEAPMPSSVIDELRNKYSKFRTRHDDEFVAKMLELDEKQAIRKSAAQLLLKTPTKDIYRIQKEAAKEIESKKELTENSLSILGEYMAKHMQIKEKKRAGGTENMPKPYRIEGVRVKTIPPQPEARI